MVCPKDQTPLRVHSCGTEGLRACPACHGLWIGFAAQEECFRAQHRKALGAGRRLTFREEEQRPLACPECNVSLTAFRVGRVEVDRCSRCHGLWLDAGEFREILNLYPAAVRSGRASRITDQAISGMDVATTEPIFQLLEGAGELTAEAAQKAAEVIVEIVSGLFSAW